MQIRHLRNSKIITEILILCVAYISMAAGVYIGIAGNDTSKAYYSLIVIIPAIVTYFSRKYIKSYPLFMVINLVFVVIAALLADTDLEFAGYVICAAAISGHSIRLKNLYVNKKQYERVQENIYDETGKSKDDMLIAVNASEKLHIAYGIFMIGFYILGGIEGNSVLMEIQAFLFVMFVLCQFVYNQVSRLYEVFVFNEGKSEFPARRIMGINVLIMIVFGIHIYNQKSEDFVLKKGPVFANIILADEINRATPRTQSALLECMEEHQVTIDGDTLQLDEPFIVIATENPIETAGTYPLPEAQLDRFLMKLEMGYPDKEEEITILNRFLKDNPIEDISNVCSKEDIKAMKNEVKNIYIHPSLIEYIVKLAEVTRNMGSVAIGISPRGSIAMVNAARAYAYVNGRNYVVPSDIKELALCVWGHRLVFNTGIVVKENREQAINEALSQVEVPTEEWSNR